MPEIDVLKKRCAALFGIEPATDGALDSLEKGLMVKLPFDFKEISKFFRGGVIGGKSHHALACSGPAINIFEETLRIRKAIGLPARFVVIAEPPESIILMDTDNQARVIWVDAGDVRTWNSLKNCVVHRYGPAIATFSNIFGRRGRGACGGEAWLILLWSKSSVEYQ